LSKRSIRSFKLENIDWIDEVFEYKPMQ